MQVLLEIHVPQRLNKHANKKEEEDHQGQGIRTKTKFRRTLNHLKRKLIHFSKKQKTQAGPQSRKARNPHKVKLMQAMIQTLCLPVCQILMDTQAEAQAQTEL